MSKRITDERLAEIEARRLRVPPENSLPEGEGYPADSALTYELLQALKAERAEVARLKAKPSHHWCMSYWEQKDRAEAAEAEVARLRKEYDVNINNLLDRIDELSGCDWSATKRQAKS